MFLSGVNNYLSGWGTYLYKQVSSIWGFQSNSSKPANASEISALHEDLDKPREKCGVFGYFSKNFDPDLGKKLYAGLIGIQHRGQNGCGLAYVDASGAIQNHKHAIELNDQGKPKDKKKKDDGLVNKVFDEDLVKSYQGKFGIAHTLYTTAGGGAQSQAHPFVLGEGDDQIALVHNGNLSNLQPLKTFLKEKNIATENQSDSAMMAEAIHYFIKVEKKDLAEAIKAASRLFIGTYSLIVMNNKQMALFRDPSANRPFSLAKINRGSTTDLVACSETAVFKSMGAKYLRDLAPGELLIIDKDTNVNILKSSKPNKIFEHTNDRLCALEYIYLMKPNSVIKGKSLSEVRRDFGKQVAKEFKDKFAKKDTKLKIDYVIPVPESGIPAATGFAQELGLPINPAIIKNFHKRTFLDNGSEVENKFSIVEDAIAGKTIVLVDDSVIKGNSSRAVVEFIRKAKPKAVHFVSASPKIEYPNRYGVNMANQGELIASVLEKNRLIAENIGADSITYLSQKGFEKVLGDNRVPETSIFDGEYKVEKLAAKNGLTTAAV